MYKKGSAINAKKQDRDLRELLSSDGTDENVKKLAELLEDPDCRFFLNTTFPYSGEFSINKFVNLAGLACVHAQNGTNISFLNCILGKAPSLMTQEPKLQRAQKFYTPLQVAICRQSTVLVSAVLNHEAFKVGVWDQKGLCERLVKSYMWALYLDYGASQERKTKGEKILSTLFESCKTSMIAACAQHDTTLPGQITAMCYVAGISEGYFKCLPNLELYRIQQAALDKICDAYINKYQQTYGQKGDEQSHAL